MNNQNQNSDTPDTPAEVLERQAKTRPLTAQTAELLGVEEYVDESGKMTDGYIAAVKANKEARQAQERAQKFMGPEPLRGISLQTIERVRSKSWEGAPKMDPVIGQRTTAFVNWLWSNHPKDAVIVYAYKNIWPTKLPVDWPPAEPKAKVPAGKPKPKKAAPAIATATPAA